MAEATRKGRVEKEPSLSQGITDPRLFSAKVLKQLPQEKEKQYSNALFHTKFKFSNANCRKSLSNGIFVSRINSSFSVSPLLSMQRCMIMLKSKVSFQINSL